MAKPPDLNDPESFPNTIPTFVPNIYPGFNKSQENLKQAQMAKLNISAVNFPPEKTKSSDKNDQVLLANFIPTSTPSGFHQFTNLENQLERNQNSTQSYARTVRGSIPSFNGVKGVLGYERLPPRRKMKVENKPAIIFSNLELTAANSKLRHSMVLKFSTGRPTLMQINEHIKNNWSLKGEFIVSLIDPRHVGIYISCEDDLRLALSKESHIINKCMYRAFRWSPDFNLAVENPTVAVWIRLPGIPWTFFNGAMLECIGNELGNFLRVDNRTLGLTNQMYARICVEVDVSKPLESEIWIGESKEVGFWQKVQYEGNIAYCSNCGLLGHSVGICRKVNGRNNVVKTKWSTEQQEKKEGKKPMNEEKGNNFDATMKQRWNRVEKKGISKASTKNHGVIIEESREDNLIVDVADNATDEVYENPVVEVAEKNTDIMGQKKNSIQIDLDNGPGEVLSDDQLYDKEMRKRSRQKEKEKQKSNQISGGANSPTGNGKTDAAVDSIADGTKKSNSEAKKVDNVATVEQRRKFIEGNEAKKVDETNENQFLKPTTEEQHRILNEKDSIGLSEEEIRYNSLMKAETKTEKHKEELECLGPCTLNMEDSCPSSNFLNSPTDGNERKEKSNEKEVENKTIEETKGDDEDEYQLYVGKNTRKKKGNVYNRTRAGSKRTQELNL